MATTRPRERDTLQSLIDAWRSGDALRAAAHFALDAQYAEAGRSVLTGRDAVLEHFTRFFRDGPRWRFEVDDVLVDGDRACIAYHFALEGEAGIWRERAGCAMVRFDQSGAIAGWREYEG